MKNTKPKVRLWSVLTGLTAILTVAAIVGNIIANQYATTLNVALNASTYKIIHGENTGDTEYFKKGFASDEEREAYEAELCATVEAEGAALLKNENNALPLASGAKVSLFGHGSVDLMYGGTGSGSVDTSKAPNLKQALEAQGITINQTLWDLYSSDSMMSKYSRMTPASISDTLEANTQYAVNEAPWSALSSAESSFAEYGDAAIVVLSRSGGEGADLPSGENGTSDSWISGQEGDGNYLALSAEEIELLRENNLLVSATLAEVGKHVRPGVSTLELDKLAEEFIRSHGAEPGFLGYGGFPNTLCMSVNEEVVHGIPSAKRILKEGDVLSVDCGTLMKGFYGDSAYTFAVGEIDPAVADLLRVTKEALYKGVAQAKAGNRVGDVASAVQEHAERHGYSVVRELVGHGLGRKMHEEPEVPNYGARGRGPLLKEGMVICIEPMINMGTKAVVFERDGWTVRTRDHKPAAHYEFAVAVRKSGPDVLTDFSIIEKAINN